MKKSALQLAALLFVSIHWSGIAASAEDPGAKIEQELSRQEKILRSKGDGVPEGYTIDRSLAIYLRLLPSGFDRALALLGPNDRWLDIGAGEGQAILDFYRRKYEDVSPSGLVHRGRKGRAVAMSIEDRRTAEWRETAAKLEPNQITYLHDRLLRDIPLEEIGQFKVITDVIGGFSYVDALSAFMDRVMSLLQLDGSFYTVLQDVKGEEGKNKPFYPNASYLTEIIKADGSESTVCAWLKSISCTNVTCEYKTGWRPTVEVYRVHKVCNEVSVPPLDPVHYQAGTPPERRYRQRR